MWWGFIVFSLINYTVQSERGIFYVPPEKAERVKGVSEIVLFRRTFKGVKWLRITDKGRIYLRRGRDLIILSPDLKVELVRNKVFEGDNNFVWAIKGRYIYLGYRNSDELVYVLVKYDLKTGKKDTILKIPKKFYPGYAPLAKFSESDYDPVLYMEEDFDAGCVNGDFGIIGFNGDYGTHYGRIYRIDLKRGKIDSIHVGFMNYIAKLDCSGPLVYTVYSTWQPYGRAKYIVFHYLKDNRKVKVNFPDEPFEPIYRKGVMVEANGDWLRISKRYEDSFRILKTLHADTLHSWKVLALTEDGGRIFFSAKRNDKVFILFMLDMTDIGHIKPLIRLNEEIKDFSTTYGGEAFVFRTDTIGFYIGYASDRSKPYFTYKILSTAKDTVKISLNCSDRAFVSGVVNFKPFKELICTSRNARKEIVCQDRAKNRRVFRCEKILPR